MLKFKNVGYACLLFGSLPAACPSPPSAPDAGSLADDASFNEGGAASDVMTFPEASFLDVFVDAPFVPVFDAAPVDAGPPTLCTLACLNLASIGCVEGKKTTCVATCQAAVNKQLIDFHPDCIAKQSTKSGVRGCGHVACP